MIFMRPWRLPASPFRKKWIIECDHTLKGGVAGFGKLQALATRPTAVLCSNDMTAIGVLRAAYMQGLRVPQDLSVIGLDDIDFAEFTLPPLTTIRLSRVELARAAFEALRQQAEESRRAELQREFLVSTSLVVRGSTAAPATEVKTLIRPAKFAYTTTASLRSAPVPESRIAATSS